MRDGYCSVWTCHGKAVAYCVKHRMDVCYWHALAHGINPETKKRNAVEVA